jgi:thioredoxin-like negative regulator of GroEL
MTVNRLSKEPEISKRSLFAIALVATFAIAAFFLTRPATTPQSASPVSGLMALKASARAAMPYDLAMTNGKPTLIEFYANWCTTCQAMAPTLDVVHQRFGSDLNRVMVNIDEPQWREPIQQFGVTGVPHLVLRAGDGAIADTFVGKVPKSILSSRIQDLLGPAS